MTPAQLDTALRPYCRRRPFRTFLIEFASGAQMAISHQEAIRREGSLYVFRGPDGGNVVFAPESVARLLDPPIAPVAS